MERVAAELSGALNVYLVGDAFVARNPWKIPRTRRGRGHSNPGSGNPTASAFAAHILTRTGSLGDAFASDPNTKPTGDSNLRRFVSYARGSIPTYVWETGKATDTKELPNYYNTPILAAGLLALERSLAEGVIDGAPLPASARNKLIRALDWIIAELNKNAGCLTSLEKATDYSSASVTGNISEDSPPNAVLTNWASAALIEARELRDLPSRTAKHLPRVMSATGAWAERALTGLIAWHHAGIRSKFDPLETLCAAAIVYRCNHKADALELADHAISVILDDYMYDGLLSRSRALMADQANNRIISCSTYEAFVYLLIGLRDSSHRPRGMHKLLKALVGMVEHIAESWRSGFGVADDQGSRYEVEPSPQSYSTSAAAGLVHMTRKLLEDELDSTAKQLLGVTLPPVVVSSPVEATGNLKRVLESSVQDYVNSTSQEYRRLGVFSMIWFGPPGTGKTSFARRLAADLGWSFLEVTQKDFLARGTDFIDTCAERLFRLLLRTRDTVVLFDELEELVQSRDIREQGSGGVERPSERASRLLTTSMLPRIHDLRDRSRIVFIFATNRLATFDAAATRLGRFDAIIGLPWPNAGQRKSIFNKLTSEHWTGMEKNESRKYLKVLKDENFPGDSKFDGYIYKDLEFIVKQIRNHQVRWGSVSKDEIQGILDSCGTVDPKMQRNFQEIHRIHARPKFKRMR